ncbi:MAG: hypothetical protein M1818_001323 [Claussenomyces sp. TS43310]|nr:MAG: hypothetical protein M1818_001323 [Claussenomyces sp. TS43310]
MSHLSQEHVQHLYDTFGELKVLDDIIRHRAADSPQLPILGYPRSHDSVDDYERFTGKQLHHFIDAAVKKLMSFGFKPNARETVAILAPSDLDFIVSFFALSRLGYTILTLSLRIVPVAIINLLRKSNCYTIIHGHSPQIESTVRKVNEELPVKLVGIIRRRGYDRPPSDEPVFVRKYDREEENGRIALIVHSSGSTGLPKPVMLTHRALLTHPTQGAGMHNFNALPWYHLYGISTSLQAMWMRKTAHLYNISLPLTSDHLIAVLEAVQPEAVHSVPYVLGLLAEKQRGVNAMKACKLVTSAGARTPDELGDRLVREGINLGVVFGTTEAGLCGDTMRREKGDDSWNYLRIYANIRKYLYMSPLGDNSYECVYLNGHPALSTSNSDIPAPGSWHSKDVFIPHSTIPGVWKYVTRLDDRVTLVNGEKVLPLPIEGRIREDRLVREAVVVGVDQPLPGLLIFRAKAADQMPAEAYLDAIWPSIADANSQAEAFSQMTREMITQIPSGVDYPQTDKGSIIRAQVYKDFADQIEEMYAKLERNQEGSLKLDLPALEDYLMVTFRDTIGVPIASLEVDFFTAGVDSLKAIQMRNVIQKVLELNGQQLSLNVVYESGNAKQLARYLYALGTREEVQPRDELSLMRQLIPKYSKFQKHQYLNGIINSGISKPKGQAVILTGATGSLGAHALLQLVAQGQTEKVYCLVRGENPMQRILDSLKERGLELPETGKAKIVPLTGDLSRADFGLDASVLAQMKSDVSLIIHIAWPVNFNIHLQSFEPHIAGLYNLLQFSLLVHRPQPAQLFFCSSISTALNTPAPASVPDGPIEDLTRATSMGYAQSKLVGEHIVQNAARAGAPSYVLRIGQIVGDAHTGIWNDKEFLPSMIRSALTLKALPDLQESCSWLPVDTLATTILQLSHALAASSPNLLDTDANNDDDNQPATFYNLVNPHTFSWAQLLAELRAAGLAFRTVPFADWLLLLQRSATAAAADVQVQNPAIKLVDFFERSYGADNAGLEDRGIAFETAAARRHCVALRSPPRIIEDGYLKAFLAVWLRRWR